MIRIILTLAVLTLAACGGQTAPAQVPVSGVTGSNGGSDTIVRYDANGHGTFKN